MSRIASHSCSSMTRLAGVLALMERLQSDEKAAFFVQMIILVWVEVDSVMQKWCAL
ncbi:uncharacterized protein G2W53_013832 [Senna tora]|uniref:Uncharacterized protein n=1 Tax=Senna tora TaxID=362788 RepID=A0A834WSU5_9FABA|nr:uncharacterized protein G2W53_013832 [Senna tora]